MKRGSALLRLGLSLIIALLISSLFIFVAGEKPSFAYYHLIRGAFYGRMNMLTTLRWTVPFIITGIAATISFRAGLFNMGLEGCIYLGGLTAAVLGMYITNLPAILHIPLCLAAAMLVGALWVYLPARLKAYRGVNEVIVSWMLSYIAVLLCQFLVSAIFQDPADVSQAAQQVRTPYIQKSAVLAQLVPPFQLNASLYIALVLAGLFFVFSVYTKYGYEHKMLGLAKEFARYGGVNIEKMQFWSFLASGAVGALAGATEVMGVHHRYIHGFSTDMGANGILVALMGRLNPVGVPLAGFFMGVIQNGSRAMTRMSNVSLDTVRIFTSIIVICLTAEGLFELLRLRRLHKEGK